MSNDLLSSVQRIMEGEEPLPQRTSNTLLLGAIQEVYAKEKEAAEVRKGMCEDIDDMKGTLRVYGNKIDTNETEINSLRENSRLLDYVLGFMTVVGTIIGSIFGQR